MDEENKGIEKLSSGQGRGEEVERWKEEAYPKLRMMKRNMETSYWLYFVSNVEGDKEREEGQREKEKRILQVRKTILLKSIAYSTKMSFKMKDTSLCWSGKAPKPPNTPVLLFFLVTHQH